MEIIRLLVRQTRIVLQRLEDHRKQIVFCKAREVPQLTCHIKLEQPILPSSTLSAKIHNLEYAAERIQRMVIRPGEVFSFWNAVGSPDKLESSRCIRNGKIKLETGGGLCQAASIIYHLALTGGLEIVERHNHSVDLYGDGLRASPIGLDATVCYGYKDLRIYNQTKMTLRFHLEVKDNRIEARLQSDAFLARHEVVTFESHMPDAVEVTLKYADTGKVIDKCIYKRK